MKQVVAVSFVLLVFACGYCSYAMFRAKDYAELSVAAARESVNAAEVSVRAAELSVTAAQRKIK